MAEPEVELAEVQLAKEVQLTKVLVKVAVAPAAVVLVEVLVKKKVLVKVAVRGFVGAAVAVAGFAGGAAGRGAEVRL